eukprot:1018158-Amphidinium_carterae.1
MHNVCRPPGLGICWDETLAHDRLENLLIVRECQRDRQSILILSIAYSSFPLQSRPILDSLEI